MHSLAGKEIASPKAYRNMPSNSYNTADLNNASGYASPIFMKNGQSKGFVGTNPMARAGATISGTIT
jgi:hypothetical protein